MGAFIARQPNGLLCRWSSIVDNITHYNMTEEGYIEYCAELAREGARDNLQNKRFVKPFSEILKKRDEDLVFRCIGVIENQQDYTQDEVDKAKNEMNRLKVEFDKCVKEMNEKAEGISMEKTTTRTCFIAKCGNKYLYEWVEPQFTSYMWYNVPPKFNTKDECLQAIGSAMRNSEKPNTRVVIKELRDTITTDVVNEEIL